jgi:hypothetical protein
MPKGKSKAENDIRVYQSRKKLRTSVNEGNRGEDLTEVHHNGEDTSKYFLVYTSEFGSCYCHLLNYIIEI